MKEKDIAIKNFHCSIHGYIKPVPTCPKCEKVLSSREQKLVGKIENRVRAVKMMSKPEWKIRDYQYAIDFILDFITNLKNNKK
jgi:hypothetical protein